MDFFETISDWRDEDERGPHIYRTFCGTLQTPLGELKYEGVERDWNVAGNTPEQNKALGRVYELKLAKPTPIIAWAKTEQRARRNLLKILDLYIFGKTG